MQDTQGENLARESGDAVAQGQILAKPTADSISRSSLSHGPSPCSIEKPSSVQVVPDPFYVMKAKKDGSPGGTWMAQQARVPYENEFYFDPADQVICTTASIRREW